MTAHTLHSATLHVHRKAVFLEESAEQWMRDHLESQDCFDLEDLIRDALSLRGDVARTEERLERIHRDGTRISETALSLLKDLYRSCLNLFARLAKLVIAFRAAGYNVTGAVEVEAGLRELAGVFRPQQPEFPIPDPADVEEADRQFESSGGKGVPMAEAMRRAKAARKA